MPKKLHEGSYLLCGSPARSSNPKANAGHALTLEVRKSLDALPQNQSNQRSQAMNSYKCKGFKSVKADSVSHAAKIFGNRLAQRLVGDGGYCCAAIQNESTGTSTTFEIAIGSIQDKYFVEQKEWLRVEAI
jgi:hypothetical protein